MTAASGRRLCRATGVFALLVLGSLFAVSTHAFAAQTVMLNLGAGLHGQAQYYPGRADRPAVLFVHDFLAAPSAPVVDALARRLDRDGVALLSADLVHWTVTEGTESVELGSDFLRPRSDSTQGARVYLDAVSPGSARIEARAGEQVQMFDVTVL